MPILGILHKGIPKGRLSLGRGRGGSAPEETFTRPFTAGLRKPAFGSSGVRYAPMPRCINAFPPVFPDSHQCLWGIGKKGSPRDKSPLGRGSGAAPPKTLIPRSARPPQPRGCRRSAPFQNGWRRSSSGKRACSCGIPHRGGWPCGYGSWTASA